MSLAPIHANSLAIPSSLAVSRLAGPGLAWLRPAANSLTASPGPAPPPPSATCHDCTTLFCAARPAHGGGGWFFPA
eukprot:CAMPEP_0195017126 /NCGR_PEP_ID=MMETSP0326_2-20130528/26381_1 /TAXON_ID=2866 ORGANISM="Crypthecodinium cohnii, Strain Seligo" /NCGR_SAMPLE_ID=MMETSP0326_2 /ASSEMBLY_ACC=CAM_ASM_000348 /LENGTH=75 /DNA_ID=CAMNT_0040033357 /DNA_START=323 /DNA_END=547 /DNA_ORIENTATION=+